MFRTKIQASKIDSEVLKQRIIELETEIKQIKYEFKKYRYYSTQVINQLKNQIDKLKNKNK
jgi:hypothetical protein